MEGVETGLFGDITMVITCDGDHHLVIVLTSVSQLSWSLSVLVLYLSSVNRGADNWDKCEPEFCDSFGIVPVVFLLWLMGTQYL